MAPRIKRFRKSLPSDLPSKEKENYFVRSINDFQAKVRRRESFRIRTIKVTVSTYFYLSIFMILIELVLKLLFYLRFLI